MSLHSATEYVAARAFALCYSPAWTPEAEALVAKVMRRDAIAAGHRKGFPAPPPKKVRVRDTTGKGKLARQMAAEGASVRAITEATGLSHSHVARLVTAARAARRAAA